MAPPVVFDVLRSSGQPLDAGVRAFLEPRLGHDFSQVRVHTDARAAESADAVGARAYTVGQHIAFAAGRYAPNTEPGQRLLAHELAHVVQQRDVVPGAAASGLTVGGVDDVAEHAADRTADAITAGRSPQLIHGVPGPVLMRQAYTPHEGTAVVVDTIELGTSTQHGSTFEARMRRTQYRTQAEANTAQQGGTVPIMNTGYARVRFDAQARQITLPINITIRGAVPGDFTPGAVAQPIPKTVDPTLVQRVGAQYVAAVDTALNDWYEVVLDNGTGAPCAGPPIPIRVSVTANPGPADFTVVVSNLTGRSYVDHANSLVMLFSGDLGAATMAHEGAHMVLGVPDEYHEDDPNLRRKYPLQKGIERERYDWSLAASNLDYPRWVQLHERHFSFVPVFLGDVMSRLGQPTCRPRLHELRRPIAPEFTVSLSVGYSTYGTGALSLGLGFDTQFDLNRRREWQLFVGAHTTGLVQLDSSARLAFLAGARVGLQRRWGQARGGPYLSGFGEGGVTGESGYGLTPERPLAPYAGAGGQAGYRLTGAIGVQLGLEAGVGVRLDSEVLRWFHAGVTAGLTF